MVSATTGRYRRTSSLPRRGEPAARGMNEGSKAYGPTSHLRVSFTRICYSCPEEIYAFEADTPPIESGGETDPIDSLLLCQKAVNEISNAGPPTSKSVFWRRRDSRKSILSSENPTDVVSQPATHKLPYLKCISGRYGTDSQQKKKSQSPRPEGFISSVRRGWS